MAQDFGYFTPTESAYTKPGAYEAAVGSATRARADYLIEMDTVYAQLMEERKQFEEQLAFEKEKEETRIGEFQEELGLKEDELAFLREQLAEQGEQFEASLAQAQSQFESNLAFQREQLESQESVAKYPYTWAEKKETSAELEEWTRRLSARQTPESRRFVQAKVQELQRKTGSQGGGSRPFYADPKTGKIVWR